MLFRIVFVLLAAVPSSWSTPVSHPQDNTNTFVARALATFQHPGVLIDKAQLDFIKGKVQSGAQPWTDAYNDLLSSDLASLSRTAHPTATVVRTSTLKLMYENADEISRNAAQHPRLITAVPMNAKMHLPRTPCPSCGTYQERHSMPRRPSRT